MKNYGPDEACGCLLSLDICRAELCLEGWLGQRGWREDQGTARPEDLATFVFFLSCRRNPREFISKVFACVFGFVFRNPLYPRAGLPGNFGLGLAAGSHFSGLLTKKSYIFHPLSVVCCFVPG